MPRREEASPTAASRRAASGRLRSCSAPPCFNPASCPTSTSAGPLRHARKPPAFQRLEIGNGAHASGTSCSGTAASAANDAQRDGGMAFSGNPRAARSGKRLMGKRAGPAGVTALRRDEKLFMTIPPAEGTDFIHDPRSSSKTVACGSPFSAPLPIPRARFHQMAENGVPRRGSGGNFSGGARGRTPDFPG